MGTLVLGLAHFVDKYGYIADVYARNNESIRFISMDVSGNSSFCAANYDASLVIVQEGKFSRVWATLKELIFFSPQYVEIYDIGRLTIVYAILAKLFRKHLTILLIGGELNDHHQSDAFDPFTWRLKQHLLEFSLKFSDLVIAKEEHMRQKLADRGIKSDKICFIGNAVPVPNYNKIVKSIDFLYLNAVIRQRHVDLLIKAIHKLRLNGETFSIDIVGFSSLGETEHQRDPREEHTILSLINQYELSNVIRTKQFTNQPFGFYQMAKFFILPGDVIYANYALLEAMSYGVIPIVFNGEGAARVVDDGVNGLIFYSLTPESLAEVLMSALKMTEEEIESMSSKARQKIIDQFSIDEWFRKIKTAKNK